MGSNVREPERQLASLLVASGIVFERRPALDGVLPDFKLD